MEQGTGQIYQLIPKIMKEIGSIGKGRKNEAQDYNFRGIDDVYNALAGPLAENGVFCVPEVIETNREQWQTAKGSNMFSVTMRAAFTFYAPDGSSVRAVTAGEGMDSGDKATNKAMSAALKYAMIDVFCIPTLEPRDSEYDSPEPQKRINGMSQVDMLVAHIEELLPLADVKPDWKERTLKAAKVSKWSALTVEQLTRAHDYLKGRIPAAAGRN